MKSAIVFLVMLASASSLLAQSPAATASPRPCQAGEFRQFDFWIGRWNVINPQTGKQSGRSEITRASQGCAIREQWTAANGTTGMSINYYDPADGEWHQDWVGGDGTILHLHGKFTGGAMVLSGESKSAKGESLNRITWSALDGGKVKQEWSTSTDNGRTWQAGFVGIYEKQ